MGTREAKRAEDKQRYQRRKAEAFRLLGYACARCGSTDRLELDHLDPDTKLFNPLSRTNASSEKWYSEVAKCQLLCYECHKLKTIVYRSKFEHGISRYTNNGCRCDDCKLAMRLYHGRKRSK